MKKQKYLEILLCGMILLCSTAFAVDYTDTSDMQLIILSLINQDPDPAIAGNILEVRIGVENIGGEMAENQVIEIKAEYPFEKISGESLVQEIGSIMGYMEGEDMKIVKFRLGINREAVAGTYDLKVLRYKKDSIVVVENSFSIDIKNRESAEVIYIDKTILIPGKEDTLKFTINNVGNAPLRDLTFSWINEDKIILPVGSDNTKYVKYIDVGESAELEYKVIADTNADAGLYELNLQLTYDDPMSNTEKEIDTIAGVYVGGGTDFDIAFSESSSGTTSFTVANVGSNPAFSVSVIVPEQQGWRVTGSNSMIIGNLNTGDYTVASFALQSSQARQYTAEQQESMTQEELMEQRSRMQTSSSLKIQIAYTDTRGQRELIEKEVSINTQAITSSTLTQSTETQMSTAFRTRFRQESFFEKYKYYIAVLVVLTLVGGTYWKYRKEKHYNPNFRFKDLFRLRHLLRKKKRSR
ncbi:COG1361 S-layer family protein [Candidatus Woesearchaeota archaeon]|nr:COG1361 S-layer family protein [Candidatus Woesearchaeota archaeon]